MALIQMSGANKVAAGIPVLTLGFRPFFFGAAVFAVPWHAHEMIYGYAGAVIAGFLLSFVPFLLCFTAILVKGDASSVA